MKNIINFMLLTIVAVSFFSFGYYASKARLMQDTEVCTERTLKENYIGDFYAHTGPTDPKGYYAHAEAFTEMIFAKCIRKELNK